MYDPIEARRLSILRNAAQEHLDEVEISRRDMHLQISKERTQFFEKIALGCGATIAATVSYVGAHSGKLHPPWLLRSELICFVLALSGSLLRNWRYPNYVIAVWSESYYQALQNQHRSRRDYFLVVPTDSIQDGKRINGKNWAEDYAPTDEKLTEMAAKDHARQQDLFTHVTWIERISLSLVVLGMVSLIALAWKNF